MTATLRGSLGTARVEWTEYKRKGRVAVACIGIRSSQGQLFLPLQYSLI